MLGLINLGLVVLEKYSPPPFHPQKVPSRGVETLIWKSLVFSRPKIFCAKLARRHFIWISCSGVDILNWQCVFSILLLQISWDTLSWSGHGLLLKLTNFFHWRIICASWNSNCLCSSEEDFFLIAVYHYYLPL